MSQRSKPSDATWQQLISQAKEEDAERPLKGARLVRLDLIDPNPAQSRQSFDPAALDELAASIAAQGVIEPIIVRRTGDRYQVVAGERRTRAAVLAGLEAIPAIIRDLDDAQAAYLTAVENLQREDLDLEDEARWLQYLYEHTPDATYRKMGDLIGKSHVYVLRRLQLLAHPDLLQQVRSGALTQRAALKQLEPPPDPPEADSVVHGVPNPPTIVERATLDAAPVSSPPAPPAISPHPPVYPPAPSAPPRQVYPWRRRPLDTFADWVARTPPAAVPPQERTVIRETVAEVRAWLERWERELGDLSADESD
jgi:ParB/RepB/Spo0J family partition protein